MKSNLKQQYYLMSSNIFLDGVENQIKIEKGLKILEFASEYYFSRAYYRNCALNMALDGQKTKSSKVKGSVLQNHAQNAEIMAELNQYLEKSHADEELKQEKENHSKQKSSLVQSPKISKVRNEISHSSRDKSSLIKESQIQKSRSKEQPEEQELDQSDFPSYDSSASGKSKKMQIIKEISQDSSLKTNKVNKSSKSKSSSQNYTIKFQDLNDVSQPSKSSSQKKNNSYQSKANFNKKLNKKNEVIQYSSSNRHPLDLSIDQIKNSSQVQSKISSASVTQFDLLRQLSSSFMEKDHIKLLIKLQNCQMQQKFIQQRIKKRVQKARQQISKVRDISWASLNIPKPKYEFKRMAYAHIIQ